jgi:uncharacterized protein
MKQINSIDDLRAPQQSVGLGARIVLILFCLAAGLSYRFTIGLLPPSIVQFGVLAGLSALFLVLALFAKRTEQLQTYWEIPFAFFIFSVAGIFGDSNSWLGVQPWFVANVLHEAPSANNPIASTVLGMVLGQLAGTLGITVPIILLTLAGGNDLRSIYIDKIRFSKWLVVGVVALIVFYLLAASGFSSRLFPNNGVSSERFIALTPALVILVLCNGLREELWFRGLFLKKYGKFLGGIPANILAAVIFASFHVQVQYTPSLPFFLGLALVLGLIFGALMQRSGNLLASVLFHAGSDIPIFLVYLSYTLT